MDVLKYVLQTTLASALLFLALYFAATESRAATFKITADPVPSTQPQPTQYTCSFTPAAGGAAILKTSPATTNTDGSVQLLMDVSPPILPAAVYTNVSCVAQRTGFADSPPSNVIGNLPVGVLLPAPKIQYIIQ